MDLTPDLLGYHFINLSWLAIQCESYTKIGVKIPKEAVNSLLTGGATSLRSIMNKKSMLKLAEES